MKKRYWIMFIVEILTVLFSGCGTSLTNVNENLEKNWSETEEVLWENTEKFLDERVSEIEENITEEEILSVQVVDGFSDIKYTEDGSQIIYDFMSQNVEVELPQYPNTANAIEVFFQNRNMEIYNSIDTDYYEVKMDYHMNIEPQRMDERVVSFLYGGDYYYGSGTEYNNSYYEGVVFDTVTGKRLQLEDIVQDVDEFEKFVESYIAIYIYNSDEILSSFGDYWGGYDVSLPEFDCDIRDNNWFFTDEGMMAICNPSSKWCLTLIRTNILIPYEDLTDYLKSDYIPEEVVAEEKKQMKDIDLYEVLYPGATSDSLAKESGLNAILLEGNYESNNYIVDDGKILYTSLGSEPSNITGIEVYQYVEGVTIAGCRIGMTYDECLECLQQYGFKENSRDFYFSSKQVINDTEWKYMDFTLINDIVVYMAYGVFESAEDYNWYFYEQR